MTFFAEVEQMPICINLGTFHVLVTTYLSYTVTGMSESSSVEVQVGQQQKCRTHSCFLCLFHLCQQSVVPPDEYLA